MLSWNEIRDRATKFAREWAAEKRESAEKQTFWNEFFEIFGVRRRSVALYEHYVQRLSGRSGEIDLFWPGTLLVEHKSAGKNLDAAFTQAADYFDGLGEDEKPRYVIVSDFQHFRLYDLEAENGIEDIQFSLQDLPREIRRFDFIAGYKPRKFRDEDPVNIKAVKAIGRLYEALVASLYPREATEKLLTRLVFCFFADDTGIFDRELFRAYLEEKTKQDGSDVGAHIALIFQVLNTPVEQRQTTLDDELKSLPYVNGGLFAEHLPAIFGTSGIRATLLKCADFDWSGVSPAIFGSMFQSVMNDEARHDIGAYYTTEKNILKVIGPLFLDDLKEKLEKADNSKTKLETLWGELERITLLDPACGCGNFLVVAYRELRRLELEVIRRLNHKEIKEGQEALPIDFDPARISRLTVERMHGIELLTFPAEIARLSLWLTDHMANVDLGTMFGKPFRKFPLTEQPHIRGGMNALTTDWESVVSKSQLTHILGNPPFIGSKVMTDEQRAEVAALSGGRGTLDYVSAWYFKAAEYIQGTRIQVGFVSTNSITQGEQAGALWEPLIQKYGISIHFAHRTFKWSSEAPRAAAVYCVIIGFAAFSPKQPRLFEYEDIRGEPHEIAVAHINPYLIDAPDIFIVRRGKPLCQVPEMGIGNKPIDGGMYLFTTEEKEVFLKREPSAAEFFRRWLGADEFLNGYERWVLWLGEASPEKLRQIPEVMRRIEAVRTFRQLSKSAPTRKLADTPTRFHVENMPKESYLLVPRVSSERRRYVPIGFIGPDTLTSDSALIVSDATPYHFGVLESEMHMTWVRAVCGRLKSDYRYSKDIVYNNFPWPQVVSDERKKSIEQAAQAVLDARAAHPDATLADLYDPDTMPKNLFDAHHALDRAVDRAYEAPKFASESERLQFLFGLYQQLTQRKGR